MTASSASPLADALRDRYVLERELGRGGMATVYLARDCKHDRRVALKVLHQDLAASVGPERFQREIRLAARLQHPHILSLYDSGEAAGYLWFTMPYVEGESLRDRLRREHQLAVDDALRITREVASALDYAHEESVVHRDIKPENILVTRRGDVLVADFGVAQALEAGAERLTATGLSIGTPSYMSPEQATGQRVDARSDVYALGCVLYEMLTGDPPHTGSTAQAVVAKVLAEKPHTIRTVRDTVPEHVDAAVAKALAKLPADRWPTPELFAEALQGRPIATPVSEPSGVLTSGPTLAVPAGAPVAAPVGVRRALLWGLVLVAGTLLGAGVRGWSWKRSSPTLAASVRFTLAIPKSEPLAEEVSTPVVFSPDGRSVVYVGEGGAGRMLYLRPLDELQPRPLLGTEGAASPAFSSNGRWVAFVAPGAILKKIPVTGGAVVTIAELAGPDISSTTLGVTSDIGSVTWGPSDVLVVGSRRGLIRVPATGGAPERMTAVDTARGETYHDTPLVLADGKTVVFWVDKFRRDESRLGLASLDAKGYRVLDVPGRNPIRVVGGQLLFGRGDGTVAAVSFDAVRGRARGQSVPVLEDVVTNVIAGAAASLADDGSLVYLHGSNASQLAIVDEHGMKAGGSDEAREYAHPRFSPDGRQIAVEIGSANAVPASNIWVYDLTSGALSRLTSGSESIRPDWTPDGRRIAYPSLRSRQWEVWWVPADGSGPEERLYALPNGNNVREVTFSPDGRFAVLREDNPVTKRDLWLLPLTGERKARPLLQTPFNELMPRVSPDGRWLAYISDQTGQYEVYVRPFPGPGGRVQVSGAGGTEPVWSPDGRRLFYRASGRLVAATLVTSPSLSVTRREELFEDRYPSEVTRPQYDIHPDGKRFVVLQSAAGGTEVVVVLNWISELHARTGFNKQ